MAKKKGGLINRLVMGKEKSEGYARASLPSNRWELFWDIFKGRFGRLVLVNLLIALFCIPLLLMFFVHMVMVASNGATIPFSQCFGVGYQSVVSMTGYSESIMTSVNIVVYAFAPIAFGILAVGLSGGAYVIRNMVWTEGIFVANDFWRGIKLNIKQILVISVAFSVAFYIFEAVLSLADYLLVAGAGAAWILIVAKVLAYIIFSYYTIMTLHMITMSVTYKVTFWQLLRNSFMFTLGLLPHNLFFVILAIIPLFITMMGGFIAIIGIIVMLLIGLSYALLVWTNYSHWIYDNFVNDKVKGYQKNRGIYEKVKPTDSDSIKKYKQQLQSAATTALSSRPIKPITDDELKLAELPTSFNRADIHKLNQSRQELYEDNERYIEEHRKEFEDKLSEYEKATKTQTEERDKRIEKAKKELAKSKKFK